MLATRVKRLLVGAMVFGVCGAIPVVASAAKYFDPNTKKWVTYTPRWFGGTSSKNFKVPSKYRRQEVYYRSEEKRGTIIIHPDTKYLYYVLGNNKAIRYGVGVGREGFGWEGRVKIGRKATWPSWAPPPEMLRRQPNLPKFMKGGIKNPLGARALYLFDGRKDTLYRIHGTNEPWTIGYNVSSGCIRMVNDDVVDLYKRARIGTPVVVKKRGFFLFN